MWVLSNNLYFPKLRFFLSVQGFSLTLVLLQHRLCLGVLRGTEVNVTGDRQCPPHVSSCNFQPWKINFQPNEPGSAACLAARGVAQQLGTASRHSL